MPASAGGQDGGGEAQQVEREQVECGWPGRPASAGGQDGGGEAQQVEREQVGEALGRSEALSSNHLPSPSHKMV